MLDKLQYCQTKVQTIGHLLRKAVNVLEPRGRTVLQVEQFTTTKGDLDSWGSGWIFSTVDSSFAEQVSPLMD